MVGTGDSGSSIGGGENADSMWLRKSYSLAMFYGKVRVFLFLREKYYF